MTILSTDIRLLESERMTDTTDGGGRRTNRVIPDGVAGNVFPKVSRVDSVYGRVNLRKVYPHVNTANLDVYAGAHFVITDAPDNARIGVLAFSTGSDFDTRAEARDRIESYVIAGPLSRATVYGRQLSGSQALLIYQRPDEPLPEVGEVYAISSEPGGVTTAQQFVRIQKVDHEVRTFTDEGGDFKLRVITLQIGAKLRYEFFGIATPSRYSAAAAAATAKLRTTTVADAARYFGIQPLSVAASAGDLELSLASVYAPIVPTTQRETPISLVSTTGATAVLPTANAPAPQVTVPVGVIPLAGGTTVVRMPTAIAPGSLSLWSFMFGSNTPRAYSDITGKVPPTEMVAGTYFSATVDHASGTVNLVTPSMGVIGSAPVFFEYTPAVEVSQTAHTKAIEITLATRGTVYSVPLLPIPAPGTLIAEYRSLGKWYRLRDNGAGELVGGDAAYGTGTVDYVTGGTTLTLGALPDVGSSLLLFWGSPVHYEIHVSDASAAYQEFTLPSLPAKPGSVAPTYTSNGVTYTLTDNGTGGLSGGGATGTINYATGSGRIEYGTRLPDFDSALSVDYTQQELSPDQSAAGGSIDPSDISLRKIVTVAATSDTLLPLGMAVVPGTATATNVNCEAPDGGTLYATLQCNNDGTVSIMAGHYGPNPASYHELPQEARGTVVGSVDNATGDITLSGSANFTNMVWGSGTWNAGGVLAVPIRFKTSVSNTFFLIPAKTTLTTSGGGTVVVDTSGLVLIETPRTVVADVDTTAPIRIDLTRTSTSQVVAGSVMFTLGGKTFIERNGVLYCDVVASGPAAGSGTPAGTINYDTGIASPTLWVRGAAAGLSVKSCLVRYGDWVATDVFFRTAGSPIRPASLYIQCTAEDGALLTGTTDQNGIITGAYMTGKIEQTMGSAGVSFGALVTAAGNEAEDWYDAANVVGGLIWKPRRVMPDTFRYSAVVLSNLPLDADILGLDPVRLPSDGRVLIYRPADVVVLHHTGTYDAGTPAAGATFNVGRTGSSLIWLEDAAKKKLAAALYTANLETGNVTMADPLDLSGYTAPISARHRIEEMGLLSDVQINGLVSLAAPLLRDFPLGSFLSGALLYGDLQARATNLFDQQTWTGAWQGTVIGSGATAQYNDIDYPIEVLNNGAVTERWRLNFTSTTAFQVIGENLGVIATGTTSADISVTNPLTGLPYFVLRAAGWGAGWAAGNQLRFDTIAAAPPTWLARTVLPGAALTGDSFDAQMRGDVD